MISPPPKRNLQTAPPLLTTILLLTIPLLLPLILLLLLSHQFGGQNHAHLSKNPHCLLPAAQPSTAPLLLLQISDLHISHPSPSTNPNLPLFQSEILPRWAPQASLLLISGDLAQAASTPIYPLGARSRQSPDEWHIVHHKLAALNFSIPVHVTPGNHDTFGNSAASHPFLAPLVQSRSDAALRTVEIPATNSPGLVVHALDCTLHPALHRPINFFGDARRAARALRHSLKDMESRRDNRPVVAFGHYPSAVMAAGSEIHKAGVRNRADGNFAMPRLAAFLSGHLHTLKGAVPTGMQAVAKSGSFELQLPDLVQAGRYRVLAFDGQFLSFRDFSVSERGRSRVEDVLITNPPRAGFCAAGAGFAARRSSHIRFLGPVGLQAEELEVFVDGILQAPVEVLYGGCEGGERSGKCVVAFGARWNPEEYNDGKLHKLTVRAGDRQSEPYVFSLDGRSDTARGARLRALVFAWFSLSDFESMTRWLCDLGMLISLLFCLPGLRLRRATSVALCALVLVLRFGPAFIIAKGMTAAHSGFGMVGLQYIRLPYGAYRSGVDVPYLMSVTILFGSIVPVCFLDALTSLAHGKPVLRKVLESPVKQVFSVLYLLKSLSWSFEISGAHGFGAALISPSCIPTLLILLWSSLRSVVRAQNHLKRQ